MDKFKVSYWAEVNDEATDLEKEITAEDIFAVLWEFTRTTAYKKIDKIERLPK